METLDSQNFDVNTLDIDEVSLQEASKWVHDSSQFSRDISRDLCLEEISDTLNLLNETKYVRDIKGEYVSYLHI